MNLTAYLQISNNNIYYFRRVVPLHIRAAIGKREFKISLRTRCPKKAYVMARLVYFQSEQLFFHHGAGMSLLDLITQLGEEGYDAKLLDEITYNQYGKLNADGEETKLAIMSEKQQNKVVDIIGAEYGYKTEMGMRAIVDYINKYKDIERQKAAYLIDKQLGVKAEPADSLLPSPTEISAPAASLSDSSMFDDLKRSYRGIEIVGKALSEVLTDFLKLKQGQVTLGTLAGIETAGDRLIMFVGNLTSEQLTKQVLQEQYIGKRRQLPNGIHQNSVYYNGKRHKTDRCAGSPALRENGEPVMVPNYKPIDEILAIGAGDKSAKFGGETAVYNEFNTLGSFLEWGNSVGYFENGLKALLSKSATKAKSSGTAKFTDGDLKMIFQSESYQQGLLFAKPHLYWLPLISLYHGNRIGEIAMLYLDNLLQIRHEEKNGKERLIWAFDIKSNQKRGQRVKNEQSMRLVPVHQSLLELGLVEYRNQLIKNGNERLFPGEHPTNKGNWGSKTSNWFNNSYNGNKKSIGFAEYCGVEKHIEVKGRPRKKVFHSLRSNWITQASRLKMDRYMSREITGHSQGMVLDVHTLSYDEGKEFVELDTELNKMHFDVDLTRIKKWGVAGAN
jgi:hypothetical protein